MNYLSTTGIHRADLRTAVLRPAAPDGSLYLPEKLPALPGAFINNMADMTAGEVSFAVCNMLLDGEIEGPVLRTVLNQAFSDPMPLKATSGGLYVAELFHGPTLSYKDAGARFATGILGHMLKDERKNVLGIVSTTGNTGAALAATFRQNMPHGARLLVLYPTGKMTRAQISQFTTPGNHVHAVEVNGTIDDCRALAARLVQDIERERPDIIPLPLNSANILRVIPQTAMFFNIYSSLMRHGIKAAGFRAVIPSGNLTNVTAALMARRMGLPAGDIVAVTAKDSTYARAIASGSDIVNLERAHRLSSSPAEVTNVNVSDAQISEAVRTSGDYLPDPHAAAALAAAAELPETDAPTVVLGTAHPAKSLDAMTAITGRAMELPLQLTNFMHNTRAAARIAPSITALKKYLSSALDTGVNR
ncbi:MAG: pyridoxal-phosphate dependent enzyme [Muribaculaceae bacterium]|nr:pyridoxal-phosphate dependent enzyme [Muribaculaceae bacterium]